jgi:hypothetical protein
MYNRLYKIEGGQWLTLPPPLDPPLDARQVKGWKGRGAAQFMRRGFGQHGSPEFTWRPAIVGEFVEGGAADPGPRARETDARRAREVSGWPVGPMCRRCCLLRKAHMGRARARRRGSGLNRPNTAQVQVFLIFYFLFFSFLFLNFKFEFKFL